MWHKLKKEHEKSTRTAIPVPIFKIIAVVILDGNPLLLLKRISQIRTNDSAKPSTRHIVGNFLKFVNRVNLNLCIYVGEIPVYAKIFYLYRRNSTYRKIRNFDGRYKRVERSTTIK